MVIGVVVRHVALVLLLIAAQGSTVVSAATTSRTRLAL